MRAGRVASLVEDVWGLRAGTVRQLSSERDANVLLDGRYVLKVSRPASSPACSTAPTAQAPSSSPTRSRLASGGSAPPSGLAGLTGPDGTVLKVRPPLIWHTGHADLFAATVAESLTEVG